MGEQLLNSIISPRILIYTLLGSNLYCLILLLGPDASILAADAQLKIPILVESISIKGFLIFGTLFLMCLAFYSQLFLNPFSQQLYGQEKKDKVILVFIVYFLTPLSLLIMVWRTLPRPESTVLIPSIILFVIATIFRYRWELYRKNSGHRVRRRKLFYFLSLWIVVSSLFVVIYFFTHTWCLDQMRSFRQLELVRANLSGKDLRNIDATNAIMNYAILNQANLTKSKLTNSQLKYANLEDSILQEVLLYGAILQSANIKKADLNDAKMRNAKMSYVDLTESKMNRVDLREADLPNAKLTKGELFAADLKEAVLYKTILVSADLSTARLHGAWLHEADLTEAIAYSTNFSLAELKKATLLKTVLRDATLRAADLSEAKIEDAILEGADMTCVILNKSTLKNTKLMGADLTNANLQGVDFQGTDLTDANLLGADLQGAKNLTCDQLKTTRNWRSSKREENLMCNEPISFIEGKINQDCDAIRNEIDNEIKEDLKKG